MPKCAGCKEAFPTEQALSDHLRRSTICKTTIVTRARTRLEKTRIAPSTVQKTLSEVKQILKSRQNEPIPTDFFDRLQKTVTEAIKAMAVHYPNQPRVLSVLQGNSAMIIFLAQAQKLKTLPDIDDVYVLRDRIAKEHGYDPHSAERIAVNQITEQINTFVQTPKTERLKQRREKTPSDEMEKVQERVWRFWEARLRMIGEDTKKEAERLMKNEKPISDGELRKLHLQREEDAIFFTWAKQLGFIAQVSTTAFWYMMVKPIEGLIAHLTTYTAGFGAAGFTNIAGSSSYFFYYVVQPLLSVLSGTITTLLVVVEQFLRFCLMMGPWGALFGGFTAFLLTFFLSGVMFRFLHGAKSFKLKLGGFKVPFIGEAGLLDVEVAR